jgi:hypothetical protein
MREDMDRVIIERPRKGGHTESYKHHRRTDKLADQEELPLFEGMRRRYYDRKQPTDLFGPLRKWLRRQVGRKWDDVHSEVCQASDLRTTGHLFDFVYTGGDVQENFFSTGREFTVDENGILRLNKTSYRYPKPKTIYLEEELNKGMIWLDYSWNGPRYALIRLSSCQWVYATLHSTWQPQDLLLHPYHTDKITGLSNQYQKEGWSFLEGWYVSSIIRYLDKNEKKLLGIY